MKKSAASNNNLDLDTGHLITAKSRFSLKVLEFKGRKEHESKLLPAANAEEIMHRDFGGNSEPHSVTAHPRVVH